MIAPDRRALVHHAVLLLVLLAVAVVVVVNLNALSLPEHCRAGFLLFRASMRAEAIPPGASTEGATGLSTCFTIYYMKISLIFYFKKLPINNLNQGSLTLMLSRQK